ncbi:MAG: hypothetical protein VXW90_01010, partial [Candidatus Thermoplasmatota archaeon]|nr:hypothetical protein [Candidatus Thermoplasmatota archaeon]
EEEEPMWNEASLPVHDTVANSMYGGAQHIFQQQVAPVAAPAPAPAPVVAPAASPVVQNITYNIQDSAISGGFAADANAHAGPPLPPGGLPAGWTMEQWTYYGQQYIDQMNQR